MRNSHHGNGKKVHRAEERRKVVRAVISAPVRVRGVVGPDRSFDETTTTVNLSATGILIETSNESYYRTMRLSVIVPYDESAGAVQKEKEARVVRVTDLGRGRRSIAISLAHGTAAELADSEQTSTYASNSDAASASQQDSESIAPLVLVLESESATSEFMKTYLSGEGYEVVTVGTLAEARSVLDQRTPSLLIAEVEGEGMPGYSLCSHCKQTPRLKPIPVMLVTSSAYPSDYAKAHSLGAVVCMAKPFKRERLGHVVRLLAPPPNANHAILSRSANAARRPNAKPPVVAAPVTGRFRLPSVFGR
jgi:CheY-like chemotaxis protein